MMSGSGPTVFGLFDNKECAEKAMKCLQESGNVKKVYLTKMYNNR